MITNSQQDSGSAGGRVLLDPGAWNIRFAAHEMGHGYGLDHSYSNDLTYQNASWSQPGEYDDMWDEMSAQHVYSVNGGTFGETGTGLNAYRPGQARLAADERIEDVRLRRRDRGNGHGSRPAAAVGDRDAAAPGAVRPR